MMTILQYFVLQIDVFVTQVDQELYNITRYLRYIRMNGDLSSRSSEQEFRENLGTLEKLINSTRCNLRTNYDISTTNVYDLSDDFVGANGNHLWELQRAFVVLRDIQRYMAFLTGMFQSTSLK